jgi:hypothetical protein
VRLEVNSIAVSRDQPQQTVKSDGFTDCLTSASFVKHEMERLASPVLVGGTGPADCSPMKRSLGQLAKIVMSKCDLGNERSKTYGSLVLNSSSSNFWCQSGQPAHIIQITLSARERNDSGTVTPSVRTDQTWLAAPVAGILLITAMDLIICVDVISNY